MKDDSERLSAYLDGELNDAERQQFESRLNCDAKLRTTLAEFTYQQNLLQIGAETVNSRAPSQHIGQLLVEPASPAQAALDYLRTLIRGVISPRSTNRFLLACTPVLLTVVYLGFNVFRAPTLPEEHNTFLNQVANSSPMGIDGNSFEHRLSYESKTGALCKLYDVRHNEQLTTNIACLNDRGWRITFNYESKTLESDKDNGLYIPASSSMPEEVERFILNDIDGNPLNAEQEAKLLEPFQP